MTIPNSTTPKIDFLNQISMPQTSVKAENKAVETQPTQEQTKKDEFKPSKFDMIMEKTINPKDLNDTVHVPRTIFKGYLSFMMGNTALTLGGLIGNKMPKLSKGLAILGTLICAVGTFEFVKPFMVKEKPKV